jgi:hypothetical protein
VLDEVETGDVDEALAARALAEAAARDLARALPLDELETAQFLGARALSRVVAARARAPDLRARAARRRSCPSTRWALARSTS